MIVNVLSIAGLDPSGGAGALADVKTIEAFGAYGMAAVAAITAQNTREVTRVAAIPADLLAAQIEAVFADIRVDAVKIGMLGSAGAARVVADLLSGRAAPVVLDPVLASSSGTALADADSLAVLCDRLIPVARVVTPNLQEAARLAGLERIDDRADMDEAADRIFALGAQAILIKGGHGRGELATDVLYRAGTSVQFSAPRIDSRATHGTGCALSSAIACGLAEGLELDAAVSRAKAFVSGAIAGGSRLSVGGGHGPLRHSWRMGREDRRGGVDARRRRNRPEHE